MRTLFIPERVTRFTHDALPHPIELEQKPDADVPHEADGTVQADGTCSRLWPTSLVLTRYLCAHPELVAGKRVVELGAGAGCVGLACAALGAEHVVITDISEAALSLCHSNVARNPRLAPRVSVEPCAWGDAPAIEALSRLGGGDGGGDGGCGKGGGDGGGGEGGGEGGGDGGGGEGGFDVVIASEVVYKQEAEVLRALAATQDQLARVGARVLLAYEFRGELFDDLAYFDAANALFECEATPLQPYEGEQAYDEDDEGGSRFLYSYTRRDELSGRDGRTI